MSSTEGLRQLNKELLTRNAELVKQLNRMKTERDNFEQLFTDWKKINKDASEALSLLQKDNQKFQDENQFLHKQIKDCQLEIASLKLQNNERTEQCDHLLLRCNQYQQSMNQLKQQMPTNANNANINTLKFNYQQKKNETEQILYQIQKLFNFCRANYPHIVAPASTLSPQRLRDIDEHHNEADMAEMDDAYELEMRPQRPKARSKPRHHKSSQSLSDFDKQIFRKRRSLNYILDQIKKPQTDTTKQQRIMINNELYGQQSADKKQRKKSKPKNDKNNNIDSKITPELLGPKTSYHQYDAQRSDPFARTLSSHSFFSEQTQQRLRYNQVTLNMNMTGTSKLWSKRDSLSRKKKQPRINAIPSSAGTTPLGTPQHSHRGRLSDDEQEDEIYFVDHDPHQKYLEMMGGEKERSQEKQREKAQEKAKEQEQAKGKETIHDLFDMLQEQQQQQQQRAAVSPNQASDDTLDLDLELEFPGADGTQSNENNAHLVPLPEPSESSSDSDSDSSSD